MVKGRAVYDRFQNYRIPGFPGQPDVQLLKSQAGVI
jgi:hypothetical protein